MATHTVMLVLRTSRELSPDEVRQIGRDAAVQLLDTRGTRSQNYNRSDQLLIESIKFNEFHWLSEYSIGPENDRDWCVTDAEREEYDSEHDDDEW